MSVTPSNVDDDSLIDLLRSSLIQTTLASTRRRRTLTSSFAPSSLTGSVNSECGTLVDDLDDQLNQLRQSIEHKINQFDRKQSDPDLCFAATVQQIDQLNGQRNDLLQRIQQQNEQIERNHLIDLAQVTSFRTCVARNDSFLKRLEMPKNQLIALNQLLEQAVQADRQHRYETLLHLLDQFDPQADLFQSTLDQDDLKADTYGDIVHEMMQVLNKMRVDRDNLREKFEYDLRKLWHNSFQIRKEQVGRELQLKCVGKLPEIVQQPNEYMNALKRLNLLSKFIDKFGQQLLDLIVNSLLDNTDQQLKQDLQVNEQNVCLHVSFDVHSLIDSKEQVLDCISNVFQFLNVAFSQNALVLPHLSPFVERIFQLIDQKLLTRLRPNGESELTNYSRLLDQTKQLQEEAVELNILQANQCRDFSLGMHTDVGNKRCNQLLLKARQLIKEDLADTQQVAGDAPASQGERDAMDWFRNEQKLFAFPTCQVSTCIVKLNDLLNEIALEMHSSSGSFRFELYRTARNILEMFVDISPLHHQYMLQSANDLAAVFHNNCFYLAHHVQLLSLKALATDQCGDKSDQEPPELVHQPTNEPMGEPIGDGQDMELAVTSDGVDDVEGMWKDEDEPDVQFPVCEEQLVPEAENTLDEDNVDEWKDDLESSGTSVLNVSRGDKCGDFVVCFVDFVPVIRDLGTEHLLIKLRQHRKDITDILGEARLGLALQDMRSCANQPRVSLQKCLDRCVHVMSMVHKCWHPILPVHVTYRSVGLLADALLKELLEQIISMEDILESGSDLLVQCLHSLLSKLKLLFERERIEIFVRLWKKTNELKFVLKAKLAEIVDRWSEGAGPLAIEFTADELKSLIRALFQNTQNRAEALAKIRNN